MNIGHFHPLVSRRVIAIVEMHCGAKTNQARKASAVARLHWPCSLSPSDSAIASSSPSASIAFAVAIAETATSRAALAGIKASAISWLKPIGATRSEEHTAELQYLMRISYVVFCFKKKKTI